MAVIGIVLKGQNIAERAIIALGEARWPEPDVLVQHPATSRTQLIRALRKEKHLLDENAAIGVERYEHGQVSDGGNCDQLLVGRFDCLQPFGGEPASAS